MFDDKFIEINDLKKSIIELDKEIIKLKYTSNDVCKIEDVNNKIQLAIIELDKKISEANYRISNIEDFIKSDKGKWDKIWNFIIQIIWAVSAAWLLMSLGL